MKRRILKPILYIISFLALMIVVLTITLWVKSPGVTQTILDADKKPLEGSISVIEKVILGDHEQYIIIRGADKTKPVMLFLHGGPGSPEVAFIKHYNSEIENDYVMVYWEQRGAGKSYSKRIPAETMNLQQMIADTRELSEYLINRFGCEKIFLMGHSWGSLLGMQTAYSYPDLYDAYFGIGQVCHQFKGEQLSYSWALDQAVERNDTKAIELLENLGVPDSSENIDQWLNYLMKQRRYVNKYGGGTTREISGMWPLVKIVMNSGIYTLGEKMNFMNASMFSLEHMWLDVINGNLFNEIDSMEVPVYIFQGTYDNTTPYPLAKEFYEQLKAPQKGFFSFENSAHSPIMEEPVKFNSILRNLTVDLSSEQCLR